MKKITSALIFSTLLSGCTSSSVKELVVQTKPVEKPKLDVQLPSPVSMQPIEWVVITDKNYEDVITKAKDGSGLVFLVAMDEKSYKNLAINNANILKYIREQKTVLAAYRKYYETPPKKDE